MTATKHSGNDFNPDHYAFPRVSNHHTPGWLFPPPDHGDKWVFWCIVLAVLAAAVLL